MNRDKKLIEAYNNWKYLLRHSHVIRLIAKHGTLENAFLASPEYKELEVTDVTMGELIQYYVDTGNPYHFNSKVSDVLSEIQSKQGGEK